MNAHAPLIETSPAIDVRILDSLSSLGNEARGMLDRVVQPSLYDRFDWLRRTATHLWCEAPTVVATARQGHHAVWLPLRDCGSRHGRGLASWYTLAFAPIFTPGCDDATRARLLARIARTLRRRFGSLTLWPLEPETTAELERAFRAQGWLAADRVEAAHWIAHTAGLDFDTYWASRASKLQNTVRRRMKSSAVETRVFDYFDATAWAAYEAIYPLSWKPAEGSPAFLRAFAEDEGAAGTLRLGVAHREGRAVAAQLWTVENGIATIHKLAHLESEREHSPGTLLSVAMFRHVLDNDRPTVIDYGNGDEAYKAEWMDERRLRHRLHLYNLRSVAGLSAGVGRAFRATLGRFTH